MRNDRRLFENVSIEMLIDRKEQKILKDWMMLLQSTNQEDK